MPLHPSTGLLFSIIVSAPPCSRKTPFDGPLPRPYIKLVVMVVGRQSATEQQNFICSANLESIMSACQICLASGLRDLHTGDVFIMFYWTKCNTADIVAVAVVVCFLVLKKRKKT